MKNFFIVIFFCLALTSCSIFAVTTRGSKAQISTSTITTTTIDSTSVHFLNNK